MENFNNMFLRTKGTKADPNKEYTALTVDLGYCEKILTCDKQLIAELVGISVRDLAKIVEKNKRIAVGKLMLPETIYKGGN